MLIKYGTLLKIFLILFDQLVHDEPLVYLDNAKWRRKNLNLFLKQLLLLFVR